VENNFRTFAVLMMTNAREADSHSAGQDILRVLCNSKVQYRVQKSPPLVPILSEPNSSTPSHPIYLRSVLIFIYS
jgi:hypothetical protein